MRKIITVTGGTKSGKSEFAEYLAKKYKRITYVALSELRPNDINWQGKIKKHKLRRPTNWKTIETSNIHNVLRTELDVLLIDSIGGFVVENINTKEDEWKISLNKLLLNLVNYNNDIIIVGEQTGWGLVSEYKLGNIFTDRIGDVLKEITNISRENWLTINGKAIKLDDIFIDIPK